MNKERILEIERIAAEQNLSVYNYCKLNGINPSNFYNCKSHYKAKEREKDNAEIIQIKPVRSETQSKEVKFLANGILISIDAENDDALVAIFKAIKNV